MQTRKAFYATLIMALLLTSCISTNLGTVEPPLKTLPPFTPTHSSPQATALSTAAFPSTPTQSSGITLDYSNVAQGMTLETEAAHPANVDEPWWVAAPQHQLITLQGYPITNRQDKPQIFVYPASELASYNENMGNALTSLQEVLQTQRVMNPMPFLPLTNAQEAMQAQVKYMDFANGSGVRYLTQFNQGPVPINNSQLIYTFQGLTSDGQSYVSAVLPVTYSELPAGTEISEEFAKSLTEKPNFYPDYISTTIDMLDQLPSKSFIPDLSKLDAMISSITIPTSATTTPTPEVFIPAPIEGVLADKTREDLASRIGVDFTQISVVEISQQDWPDNCLGLAPQANQECTKTDIPGWRIVLNAAGHTHEYRATEDGSLVSYSGPVMVSGPKDCMIDRTSLIYSPEDGYCFAYPLRFHRTDERGPIAIYGPAYGSGPEPLYASLTIEISPLPDGQNLDGAVNDFLAQFGNVPMPETRLSIMVGGEPALMLEVVPGMLGSRDVFFIHSQQLFHLTFWPAPSVASDTAADVEDLYQTVLTSWSFQS